MIRYFYDDIHDGWELPIGPKTVTKEEIIEFASQFDPAPFHLDEEAGRRSMLGGLSASGWHVCAMAMRMICDTFLLQSSSQGSPGILECNWRAPVLAGDTLSGRLIAVSRRLSGSRPGIGLVEFRCELFNQKGVMVMDYTNTGMLLTREAA